VRQGARQPPKRILVETFAQTATEAAEAGEAVRILSVREHNSLMGEESAPSMGDFRCEACLTCLTVILGDPLEDFALLAPASPQPLACLSCLSQSARPNTEAPRGSSQRARAPGA
jgi:hypothetical protein